MRGGGKCKGVGSKTTSQKVKEKSGKSVGWVF